VLTMRTRKMESGKVVNLPASLCLRRVARMRRRVRTNGALSAGAQGTGSHSATLARMLPGTDFEDERERERERHSGTPRFFDL